MRIVAGAVGPCCQFVRQEGNLRLLRCAVVAQHTPAYLVEFRGDAFTVFEVESFPQLALTHVAAIEAALLAGARAQATILLQHALETALRANDCS